LVAAAVLKRLKNGYPWPFKEAFFEANPKQLQQVIVRVLLEPSGEGFIGS